MTDHYLFLSSQDSIDVRKNNDPSEFYIELPKPYALQGYWDCGLTEISFTTKFTPRSKRLYLCCDLVEESYVNDTLRPILRNVEVQSRYGKLKSIEFVRPLYVKIRSQHFQKVRLYLLDESLLPVQFETNDLHCVLHLRKRWAA